MSVNNPPLPVLGHFCHKGPSHCPLPAVSLGLEITKFPYALEYQSLSVLHSFIKQVTEARKQNDIPGGNPMLANTYKLMANSFYRGSVINKDKHSQVVLSDNQMTVWPSQQDLIRVQLCTEEWDQAMRPVWFVKLDGFNK